MATARVLRWGAAVVRCLAGLACVVLVLPAVLRAGPDVATAQDDEMLIRPVGMYRGRVVDAQTGQPIPDAVVIILWRRVDQQSFGPQLVTAREAFTDSQGEFVHDVRAVETKLPPGSLAPRVIMFRPGYTPVPDQPQVRPPGMPAGHFAAPGATARMTAVSDHEDRSEAFNTFIAMLSAAHLFPTSLLPDTTELIRFELQSLGARPLPADPPRGGR